MTEARSVRRVAIDAQFEPGGQVGGVETHLIALVQALGRLEGPEQYFLVCPPNHPDWLKDYMGPNQRLVVGPMFATRRFATRVLGKHGPRLWGLAQAAWLRATGYGGIRALPPGWISDYGNLFEELGAGVVHVFSQKYVRTTVPTVFNPHDLQHEHYPQFFSSAALARRRHVYSTACRSAAAVVAASRFTRDDVISQYGVFPDKTWIIPFGPAIASTHQTVSDPELVAQKYKLDHPFMLYPAQTWEHKNHMRLLQAIVRLRHEGIRVNLVCTGTRAEPTWSKLERFISENRLYDQVVFLGYVPSEDLGVLYSLCQFVVAPSLFEQASGPMIEAWHSGVPVAASNVTSLPDQAGDAALLFDPASIEDMAAAIRRMSTDAELRELLRRRGQRRLQDFSWERTAKAYRALYRRIAEWPMTAEDHYLLGWDWMREPRRGEGITRDVPGDV